ncbi:hypothetical protein FACS189459_0670 [Bacilli bacterium]|nr:hypothetical protein FACS189459_0670 [Bacilli bacterium]
MKEIIGIRNLNVEFGTKKVLSDINLDFETGKITVIVGRNGSGKSVLLQTILNLIKYTGDI